MNGIATQQKLLVAQSAVDAVSAPTDSFLRLRDPDAVHTAEWAGGATAGMVVIEVAARPDSAVWTVVDSLTPSGPGSKFVAGPYRAVRHRISVAVSPGSVTSYMSGTT